MPETPTHERSRMRELVVVFASYLVLASVMTWPLAAGLTTDVPGDLGDSLLNMWILGWGAEHVPRVATGQMAIREFWNANIFHPEPLALSLSETLFAQVLQILPIYQLTHNLILCYNLLFLSAFALSGLGMYLLAGEFTENRWAAFLAGLIFAFVPYRIAQIPHLQTISSQWMPLALFGFRRAIVRHSRTALVGGTAALLMQNWSCGYYLIYFALFVLLFVIHQIVAAGRGREWKLWLSFAAAAAVVAAGTWPMLNLYLQGQRIHALERPLGEIIGFSADVYSYFTAAESMRVVGGLVKAWPKAEGELFLGFIPSLLALLAIVVAVGEGRATAVGSETLFRRVGEERWSPRRVLTAILGVALVVLAVAFVANVATGGFVLSVSGIPVRATNAPRLLGEMAMVIAALTLLSGKFRHVVGWVAASPVGIALGSLLLAVWLSLGPVAHSGGLTLDGLGLYGVLLDHVPGFGGLRVPARLAMIAALYLALLAGLGARALARPLLILAGLLFVAEAWIAPMPINQAWGEGAFVPPPRVEPASSAPPVYRYLATLPDKVAVVEFPFGDPAWELRYVYYSTVHWKPILNGYSGAFPQHYKYRVARLQRIRDDPEAAARELRGDEKLVHVVVHEDAMTKEDAVLLKTWLETHGYREAARFGHDVLYRDITWRI